MAKSDDLRAELEVVELEEALIQAKGTKKGPSREQKLQVREARRAAREAREAEQSGDGVARPKTVRASAGVNN